MGMFIAIAMFGLALVSGGLSTGQKNPDAKNIFESNPHIVKQERFIVDE